jgi:ferrous iron transport protein A
MHRSLDQLEPGDEAAIIGIRASEALHHRLSAMGFRPGKIVLLIRRGAFHGPLHVRIGQTDIIIRRRDAAFVKLARQT